MPENRNPSHPGEILKELYMEPLQLSVTKLAAHLGCTRVALSEIVNCRRGISPAMACRLADVFKTSPELWMNLQISYDLAEAKRKHKKRTAIAC